jgi:glycosyltransferase involved in cell wall biosynthesis
VAYLFHEAERLGAGLAVLRVLDLLGERGWSAAAWFPGQGPLQVDAAEIVEHIRWAPRPLAFSVRGWRAAPGCTSRLTATPAYLRAVREALQHFRPHVVHANTLLTLPEATVARSLGLPVVLHVHELPEQSVKTRATVRWAHAVADVAVAVSSPVAELLGGGSTPVVTVRNGVPPAPRGPRAVPGGSGIVVGTVGSVSRRKGTDLLQLAAARVAEAAPEVVFEVAGPLDAEPDTGFVESIVAQASRSPLARRFRLLGPSDVGRLLPRWDVFVLPSRQDPFPLASLEAMAAGVPVIAADVGGLREQIEHLKTGILVPRGDSVALAEWIVKLARNAELRTRLARAAKERVRSAFSLEQQAETLSDVYLAAMNLRFAPPSLRRETTRWLECA